MIWFLLACYPQPHAQEEYSPFTIGDAQITEVSSSRENDQWRIELQTDAWTSNGTLWLAEDLDRYEKHPLYSIEAADDGSSDNLRIILDVVPDWNNFVAGESTGWLCSEAEALSSAIVIYHGETNLPNDCIYWGDDIWGDFPNVADCDFWPHLD